MILRDFEDVTEVPAAEWARLADGDLYSTTAWMRFAAPYVGKPHVLLDRDAMAASVGYLFTAGDAPAPFRRPDRMIATKYAERIGDGRLDEESLTAALLPALVLGGLRLHDSTVLLGTAGGARRNRLAGEFLGAVAEHASRIGARSVVLPYVNHDDDVLRAVLAGLGYRDVPMDDAAYLTVDFASLDEYVAARPKSRRGRIRSELRKLDQAGVRVRFSRLTHELAEYLVPFEAETWRRHGMARSIEDSRNSLHGLADLAVGEVIAGVAELDGELLAFTTAVHYRDRLFVRNFGRLDIPPGLPVYFGLVYYAHIELAIQRGVREICYGLKSEEAKRARGCRLVTQHCYLAPAGPAFPDWVNEVIEQLQPHEKLN